MGKTLLYIAIYNAIKTQILDGVYPDGAKLPTGDELAKKNNVSKVTVNKAMSLLVDEGLVFRTPGQGTFVKANGFFTKGCPGNALNGSISLIVNSVTISFGRIFVDNVIYEAKKKGFCVMLGLSMRSPGMESEFVNLHKKNNVRGFIVAPFKDDNRNSEIVKQVMNGFPVVFIDRYLDGISASYVGSKNREAAILAMNHLFKLGHKNIAFITPSILSTSLSEREMGFITSYAMAGCKYNPEFIVNKIISTAKAGNTPENVKKDIMLLKTYFTGHPEITGILCSNNAVWRLTSSALNALGKRIPRDISLICFDSPGDPENENFYAHIIQNEEEMAVQAVSLLFDQINGDTAPKQILLDTRLYTGQSTGPVFTKHKTK